MAAKEKRAPPNFRSFCEKSKRDDAIRNLTFVLVEPESKSDTPAWKVLRDIDTVRQYEND